MDPARLSEHHSRYPSTLGGTLPLDGYEVHDLLQEGTTGALYRATEAASGRPVVVEVGTTDEQRRRLRHAAQIAASLTGGVTPPHELHNHPDAALLVVASNYVPLSLQTGRGPMEPRDALAILAATAEALQALHDANIVHGQLRPAHVLLGEDGRVQLIGLGRAHHHHASEGTTVSTRDDQASLRYLAPEQTGRLPFGVDPRADLYCLGLLAFELLHGAPPFTDRQPSALIHAHLARAAPRLDTLHPDTIPPAVAGIVERLLHKAPDDRYASASGARHDLSRAATLLAGLGTVPAFELGSVDVPRALRFPARIIGRHREATQLLDAFARCRGGACEAIEVRGRPGTGKTSLVHTLAQPVIGGGAWFCVGRFDPYRDTPYQGWAEALGRLVEQVLAEDEEHVQRIEEAVRLAVGSGASILIQLLPQLEQLLGPQPAPPLMEGSEAQARSERLLRRLLRGIASPSHPVVLVLEDLHWADAASLRLLEGCLADDGVSHLLVVLTDRPDELPEPIARRIGALRAAGQLGGLQLGPLTPDDLQGLVGEVLRADPDEVAPLAELVFQKSQGNPFAARQLLTRLHERGRIQRTGTRWVWDLTTIRGEALSDDVAVVMAGRIAELPEAARRALAVAACIGPTFELPPLATVLGVPLDEADASLAPAISSGFLAQSRLAGTYRFLHERVLVAARDQLDRSEQKRVHAQVGEMLLDATADPTDDPHLLDIVDHLNQATPMQAQRTSLAALNLAAAQRARQSLAFEQAAAYARAALELLPEEPWASDYELTLALHQLATEVAYHTGDQRLRHQCADGIMAHAATALDQVPVRLLSIREDLAAMRWGAATDTAIAALATLGVALPRHPNKAHVGWELARTWRATRGPAIREHGDLPATTDPNDQAVDELLVWCATAGYFAAPDLVPVCGLRMARLAVERGVGAHSAFGFALMGMVMAGVLERTDDALEWADTANHLMARFQSNALVGKVGLLVEGFTRGWAEPVRHQLPVLLERREAALDVGDQTFAVYCGAAAFYNAFAAGWSREQIDERFAEVLDHARSSSQHQAWPMFACWGQLHACLADPAHRGGVLDGEMWAWPQEKPRLLAERDGNSIAHSATAAGQLAYLFGDWERALDELGLANTWLDGIVAQLVVPIQRAYHALAHLEASHHRGGVAGLRHRRAAAFHGWRLRRWAARNPNDYGALSQIVDAEASASTGQVLQGLAGFEAAAAAAQQAHRPVEQALALERCGTWAARAGMEQLATERHAEAAHTWAELGWHGKAEALRARHGLARDEGADEQAEEDVLLEAIRSLSGEIELEQVLARMLELVLQISGAQHVALLMARDEGLVVVAERDVDVSAPRLRHDEPLTERADLPTPVFNYVRRTDRSLYLPEAREHDLYHRSPALARRGVRCLMCVPLRAQNQQRGLLYLEHRQIERAIDASQVSLIEALCAQAAISIENAELYESVDRALAQATAHHDELHEALQRLRVTSVSIQRLGSILRGISDAVLVFDSEGQLSFANEAARQLLPHDGVVEYLTEAGILQPGVVASTDSEEHWLPTTQGRLRVRVARGELTDADGEVRGAVLSLADITERQRAEEALREARAAAEAANRSKSTFLANMSHELRTPLNAIIGYADLLDDEVEEMEPAELRADLQRIRGSGRHLLQLINDILDLSKIEADRLEVLCQSVTPAEVWKRIADPVRILAADNRNELVVDLEPAGDTLYCDTLRTAQILLNLLSNAAKFTEQGRIEVHAETDGTDVLFHVTDSGIGMTEEQLSRVFEAFQQAESHTSHTYGGTGLGLALSRRLAELMGGGVTAVSSPGAGSTFTLRLPQAPPPTDD